MIRPVLQYRFQSRQLRCFGTRHTLLFSERQSLPIRKRSRNFSLGNLGKPFLGSGVHEFTTLVRLRNECEIIIDLCELLFKRFVQFVWVAPRQYVPQTTNFGLSLRHFKACPYLMDSVRDGFKLCRLVDDILWRCDLAAIV